MRFRGHLLVLVSASVLTVGGCPFKSIRVDAPVDGAISSDPVQSGASRVGGNFDVSSVEVRIDGVDLIAALGLTPPFAGAGGSVPIGGDLVSITNFTFTVPPTGVREISLDWSGLSTGTHQLEVSGETTLGMALVSDVHEFTLIAGFQQVATTLSAGAPRKPQFFFQPAPTELFTGSLGQPLAGPPATLPSGGELRSGFVEVVEARIAGAGP